MTWETSDSLSVVSALAAIASAIYAGMTYRATVALKKHDSSLQLRLANETLRVTVSSLPDLLEQARGSRPAVLSAMGMLRSSAMQAWEKRAGEIQAEIGALQQQLPADSKPDSLSLEDLNDLIIATYGFQQRASAVRDQLNGDLSQDDRQRGHIQENQRASMAARMTQPSR